jgi:hypothetical protein
VNGGTAEQEGGPESLAVGKNQFSDLLTSSRRAIGVTTNFKEHKEYKGTDTKIKTSLTVG